MSPVLHFVRHYIEMVVAMVVGMVALGLPAEAALRAVGTSRSALENDAPSVLLLGMAVTMTIPMIGWMRYRGHRRRPCVEMAASMFIPTFGVIALMWTGVEEDFMTLMGIEHAAMLPSMLAAMLLRPREYACRHHAPQPELAV
jgi:hypothetical protein